MPEAALPKWLRTLAWLHVIAGVAVMVSGFAELDHFVECYVVGLLVAVAGAAALQGRGWSRIALLGIHVLLLIALAACWMVYFYQNSRPASGPEGLGRISVGVFGFQVFVASLLIVPLSAFTIWRLCQPDAREHFRSPASPFRFSRRRVLSGLLLIFLVPLAVWLWFARLHTPAWKIVKTGALLTREPLAISSNTVVIDPPNPGVVFATVRKLGDEEEFTYILLLKYGGRITSHATSLIGHGHRPNQPPAMLDHFGKWAETAAAFELNDKPVEASYRAELDDTRTAVANESLTIGGKPVDMTLGRLFLIDLTINPPAYRQISVELPPVPSKVKSPADAEQAAEAIRKHFAGQAPEIMRANND